MTSKYDSIETAADLVREVQIHGLSIDPNDICRAQDIFGYTSVEELARLANDIGRNNDQGEPDPKGSWSSNRRPTRDTFYMIAFSIWNWEVATHFWNEYTNPEHEMFKELKKKLKEQEEAVQALSAKLDKEQESLFMVEEYNRLVDRCDEAERRADAAEAEILVLKARLYDFMTNTEEEGK